MDKTVKKGLVWREGTGILKGTFVSDNYLHIKPPPPVCWQLCFWPKSFKNSVVHLAIDDLLDIYPVFAISRGPASLGFTQPEEIELFKLFESLQLELKHLVPGVIEEKTSTNMLIKELLSSLGQ